jgi:hypothetical protein
LLTCGTDVAVVAVPGVNNNVDKAENSILVPKN